MLCLSSPCLATACCALKGFQPCACALCRPESQLSCNTLTQQKKKSNTFCTGKYETARLMNRDCIDFHAYYSTQLKGSVCPFRSVPVVQLPGKHLQMKLVLNRLHAWGFVFVFFPLGTQYFSQNIKGSGKGFQLTAGRSQLVHELL